LNTTVGAEEPGGDIVAVKLTRPEKRLELLIVIFAVADLPGEIVTLCGVALREKPGEHGYPACGQDILQAVRGCISHPEKL